MSGPCTVRRIVVTSNVRYAGISQTGSYFRVLDLEHARVSFVTSVPDSLYRRVDPNPRGGVRGGRGVAAFGDRLVVGNAERLFVFDPSWTLVEDITHPLLANIHDVHADERGIWVAATGSDTLVLLGWDGRLLKYWSFRDDEHLVEELGLPSSLPPFDASHDYRDPRANRRTHTIHINAVAPGSGGLLLGFGHIHGLREPAGGESAIVRLDLTAQLAAAPASVLDRRPAPNVPNHNVAEADGLLLFNDSNRGALVAYDWRREEDVSVVPVPGNPSFARGLARFGPSLWLVGSQEPFAVYLIDVERELVVADFPLGGVENECVFAICPLPDAFADPFHPSDADPFAFWRRAAPGKGMTPIPA